MYLVPNGFLCRTVIYFEFQESLPHFVFQKFEGFSAFKDVSTFDPSGKMVHCNRILLIISSGNTHSIFLPQLMSHKKMKPTPSPSWVADIQLDQHTVGTHAAFPIPERLGPLGRMNLFIGANNSGKSRLLRSLWNSLFESLFCDNTEIVNLWYELATLPDLEYGSQVCQMTQGSQVVNPLIAFPIPLRLDTTDEASLLIQLNNTCDNFRKIINERIKHGKSSKSKNIVSDLREIQSEGYAMLIDKTKRLQQMTMEYIREIKINRTNTNNPTIVRYIPTLRGFRSAPHSNKSGRLSYYDERTIADYNQDMRQMTESAVFTGGSFNQIYKEILLGRREDRDFVRNYEDFLSRYFFGGKSISITPELNSPKLLLEIENEKEQLLEHIGDGIQHLIVITFAAFNLLREANQMDPSNQLIPVVLVEEPELFLHPGFQRQLVKALMSEDLQRVQFFATTQSNHLLEIGLEYPDVSVFHISKEKPSEQAQANEIPTFTVRSVPADDRVLLDHLGVNQASVMLANCVIMVEGITDRWYLQRLLECYFTANEDKKSFILDLHYTFAEYGGACMAHYDFCEGDITTSQLFGNYLCIADKDDSKWKNERNEKIRKLLKDQRGRFEVLPCREVENLISLPTAKSIIASCYPKSTSPITRIGNGDSDSMYDAHKKYREMSFFDDFGCSYSKRAFCEKALKELRSFEDFAPYAIEVADRIYNFVADRNK